MKNRNIGLIGICLFAFCSCDSWLSVSPSNEMPVEDQFGSEQGVKDALAGAYVLVKDQNLYGKALSFGYIENMASLWDAAVASVEESLTLHEYDKVTGAVDDLYGKMYNAIANVNNILDHIHADNGVLLTPGMYEIIRGECLALRAFLHFDLMRLFGPVPADLEAGGAKLPYVKVVSKEIKLPVSYDEYKNFLLEDLRDAAALLKAHDPIVVESSVTDEFLLKRTCRMNYYAVKALQARAFLWYGEKENASAAAMEVIEAKNSDGSKKFDIEAIKTAFPGQDFLIYPEQIFGLYDHRLDDKYSSFFRTGILYKGTSSQEIMKNLYGNTGKDFRELYLWELQRRVDGDRYTIKKYNVTSGVKQIPLIRLSELYFIAIESGSAEQGQKLWDEYRDSRVLDRKDLPTDPKQLQQEILTEFRKEFYAEGQLFYLYKRYNSPREDILFANSRLVVNYILPLPKTELK